MSNFRPTAITDANLAFARRKYLANMSINCAQTTVGVVTKPLNGYVAIMLENLTFADDTDYETEDTSLELDYVITK